MLTHLHSTSILGECSHISEGDKGTGAFSSSVKIYGVSLFNLIALKTSTGRHAFWSGEYLENIHHMFTHMQHILTLRERYAVCSHIHQQCQECWTSRMGRRIKHTHMYHSLTQIPSLYRYVKSIHKHVHQHV